MCETSDCKEKPIAETQSVTEEVTNKKITDQFQITFDDDFNRALESKSLDEVGEHQKEKHDMQRAIIVASFVIA